MSEPNLKKTHELLEKLAEYVMNKVPRRDEVSTKSEMEKLAIYVMNEVSKKSEVDKLAAYVMSEVPTKRDLERVERDVRETKDDVKLILDGMDSQVKEMEILKTEQVAIKFGLGRVERRVDEI